MAAASERVKELLAKLRSGAQFGNIQLKGVNEALSDEAFHTAEGLLTANNNGVWRVRYINFGWLTFNGLAKFVHHRALYFTWRPRPKSWQCCHWWQRSTRGWRCSPMRCLCLTTGRWILSTSPLQPAAMKTSSFSLRSVLTFAPKPWSRMRMVS